VDFVAILDATVGIFVVVVVVVGGRSMHLYSQSDTFRFVSLLELTVI